MNVLLGLVVTHVNRAGFASLQLPSQRLQSWHAASRATKDLSTCRCGYKPLRGFRAGANRLLKDALLPQHKSASLDPAHVLVAASAPQNKVT